MNGTPASSTLHGVRPVNARGRCRPVCRGRLEGKAESDGEFGFATRQNHKVPEIAPRVSFAWSGKSEGSLTVLRGGFGCFALSNYDDAAGWRPQIQTTLQKPGWATCCRMRLHGDTVQRHGVTSNLRAPIRCSLPLVDQQLFAATLSLNYLNARGTIISQECQSCGYDHGPPLTIRFLQRPTSEIIKEFRVRRACFRQR